MPSELPKGIQRNVAEVLAEFARVGSNFFNYNSDLSNGSNELEAEEEAFLKMHTQLKREYLGNMLPSIIKSW